MNSGRAEFRLLAPHRRNDTSFDSSFYLRGYSGWALRLAKYAIAIGGVTKVCLVALDRPSPSLVVLVSAVRSILTSDLPSRPAQEVKEFCNAPTLAEQRKIWDTKLRPVFLSKWIVKLFLSNSAFLWNALGVPMNQAQVFLQETTTEQFAIDTLDPVAYGTHIKTGAYHYKVCLEQKYSHESW